MRSDVSVEADVCRARNSRSSAVNPAVSSSSSLFIFLIFLFLAADGANVADVRTPFRCDCGCGGDAAIVVVFFPAVLVFVLLWLPPPPRLLRAELGGLARDDLGLG